MVVLGLGVTGRAVTSALLRRGLDVVTIDDRPSEAVLSWAADNDLDVLQPDDAELQTLLRGAEALLPAPGLPDHHPAFAAAAAVGTPVMSEFDLAAQWDNRPVVAVTGTDGKTTVVTLIEQMLTRSGQQALAVGNTDTPWVEAIDDPSVDVFVVEASSFRLAHSQRFAPKVAAWLNFGPDHLDAHADLGTYEAAKASIWDHLAPDGLAVANRDDPVVARHAAALRSAGIRVQTFGPDEPPTNADHGVVDATLVSGGLELLAVRDLQRAMPHDIMNGLTAAGCAHAMGASREAIVDVLRTFEGLEHRVQFVAEIDGVRYINDSKATTPHAAAAALGGFDSIVLLAGGKNKGLSFDDMVAHADRIRHVVALGDAAADIEAVFAPKVATTRATSMQEAVHQARTHAQPGDAVLLSPACASFDWYRSYVHRGIDFMNIVHELQSTDAETEVRA
jgi:UDP-N-acetylmuramoylalanine--D-glutamate ligase